MELSRGTAWERRQDVEGFLVRGWQPATSLGRLPSDTPMQFPSETPHPIECPRGCWGFAQAYRERERAPRMPRRQSPRWSSCPRSICRRTVKRGKHADNPSIVLQAERIWIALPPQPWCPVLIFSQLYKNLWVVNPNPVIYLGYLTQPRRWLYPIRFLEFDMVVPYCLLTSVVGSYFLSSGGGGPWVHVDLSMWRQILYFPQRNNSLHNASIKKQLFISVIITVIR